MALLRISMREFRRRAARTCLTIFSIVIAVAALVSVSIMTSGAKLAQELMIKAVSGNADLEVRSEGGFPFDDDLLKQVQADPDVQSVSPSIRRFCNLFLPEDKKARVQVMGVDASKDSELRDYEISQGSGLTESNDVLIDESFARSLKIEANQNVRFLTASGIREARVAGLVKPKGVGAVMQSSVVVTRLSTAQRWFRSRGKVDLIQIVAKPEANLTDVAARLKGVMPEGMDVRKPTSSGAMADETTRSTQEGLRLATMFALVLAIFIIFNTFQMNIGERRRQLGILRALGTTKKQIVWMVIREGILLGVVGVVLGWGFGILGASFLISATERLLAADLPGLTLTGMPFLISAVCGFGVTFLGVIFPAWRASRMQPAEAMRVISTAEFQRPSWLVTMTGIVMMSIGLSMLWACVQGWLVIEYSTSGSMLTLLGWILILPSLLDWTTSWVNRMIAPWIGIEAKLARRQLLRHRNRSTLTIGVLFIAISTGLGLASTILDNIRDVRQWYERSIIGDFFVRAAMPDMSTGKSADMPDGVREKILAIPGIEHTDNLRFVSARSGETSVVVVVREFKSDVQEYFDLVEGNEQTIIDQLREGGIVLGSVLAQRLKLGVGSEFPLNTQEGVTVFRVVGIANDYIGGGLTVYQTWEEAKRYFNVDGSDAYIVQADDSQLAEVETELRAICDEYGLMLQSYKDLVSYINTVMNGAAAGLWGVLALCSLIAAFGLINTLAMNILEQTREIGMLRVVAMTRGQVRKMILAQAILMGLIAIIPGHWRGC